MSRQKLASAYLWIVAAAGIGLWLTTTALAASGDLSRNPRELLSNLIILLALTFLSSISPMHTRHGSTVTVGLAPLFGAFMVLPPWAVMWVAAVGTIDERLPGRRLAWKRFFFNRGMFVLVYGLPSLLVHGLGIAERRLIWYLSLPLIVVLMVALNVSLFSFALVLMQVSNFLTTAKNTVAGNWLTYIALPLIGYLIAVLLQAGERFEVFLLYGPLLVYRASLRKQNRLDRWLRDSFIMQSRIVDKRDGQTFGHSQRVGELCEAVARLLKLNEEAINTIRTGGILHDLGKIAIPDGILLKPAKLTPEEYEIIKTHPIEGAHILAEHPEQRGVAEIVMHHHEKWDGSGYPDGLRGEQIPIGSRIVNVCDAFDTMTVARIFRPTVKTPTEAMLELRQLAGSWYDPVIVGALEKIIAERLGVLLPQPEIRTEERGDYGQVLAVRPFRLLLVGQAVSYFGDTMNTTGLAIMLFLVTQSPALVGLGLIAKAAPTILFGLVAGPLVDRFDRQRLMVGADLLRALLTVTIPFLAISWLPGVFLSVFLIASASVFFNPAKQAILPSLVPNDLLVRANGLISSSEKAMELVGYSLAGIIAALLSWAPLFLIDAATYMFSAITLLGVRDKERVVQSTRLRLISEIAQGSRFILRSAALRSTMTITFLAALFGGMTFPTLVVLTYGPLNGGAAGYGILEAVIGAGAIIGALVVPAVVSRFRLGTVIVAGVSGIGFGYALTGLTQNLWLAGGFLFVSGLASMMYYIPVVSVAQREAPDDIRGRVMASRFLVVQLGLLGGMAVAGPATEQYGSPFVFVTAGVSLVALAVAGLAFPGLRGVTLRGEPAGASLKATAAG